LYTNGISLHGFRPIPLGVFRGKRKKRKKKKEIMGKYVHFLCSLIFIICFYGKIIISIISISVHYILLYQALIPELPLLTSTTNQVVQCSSSHCLPTPTHLSTFLARHLGKVEYHCYLDSSPPKIAAVFAAFSYGFPFPCGNVWLCMAGNFWLADNCVAVYSTIL
jgi:hypothetical protein